MADVIKLSIDGIVERFKSLGPMLAPTVYVALLASTQKMLADVTAKRMSNPRLGSSAKNLGVDTGTARRSMVSGVRVTEEVVSAFLGSPTDYVAVHEQGFSGTVAVPAHTARWRHGKAKLVHIRTHRGVKFAGLSKKQKARGEWTVRSHSRKMNIVAKHFIRDTVVEATTPTANRVTQALLIAFKTGRVPSIGQVGG